VSFSHDGTKVLYPEYVTSSTDMYVSNLDGTGVVLISNDTNGYEDEGQSWSPDGTKTVWTQEDANTGNYQVMLSNPDGTGLVDLTQEPTAINTQPAWGPGGAGTPCASPVVTTTTAASSDPSTPKFTG
jgi:Tol biopolymer transport system component